MIEAYDEVRRFLALSRGSYRRLLDAIVGELEDFRDRGRNRELVYRIYTRADKQVGGDALKSVDGIVKKLIAWRGEAPVGARTKPQDIHDIIGITVVTYFESSKARIVAALQREDAFKSFEFIKHETKLESGYFADHLIVKGRGVSRSRLKCEIQVKTLLHDGWASKTHDLTYKARNAVDPAVRELTASVGNIVQNLEEQSEALRGLIQRDDEIDRERRDSAIKHMLLVQGAHVPPTDLSDVRSMFEELMDGRQHFSDCSETDLRLTSLMARWQDLFDPPSGTRDLCRFIVALAAIRVDRDLDGIALDAVADWESCMTADTDERPSPQERALAFRALAHWVLGDIDGAEEAGGRLVRLLEAEHRADANAYLDLAYYLAERLYMASPGTDLAEERAKIQKLVDSAPISSNTRKSMSSRDTLGAIMIMTATDAQTVTRGMTLCEKAYRWAEKRRIDVELFKLFHDLHMQRAKRQLRKLANQ